MDTITGTWQIVSSIGMKEYLQKWKPLKICDALFQVGIQHFEFDEDTEMLTMYESIGTEKYNNIEAILGEKVTVEEWTFTSFVENNCLVTVFMGENDEEFGRVERVVEDEKLSIVVKRFGMSCTRIYEKIGEQNNEEQLVRRVIELEMELRKTKGEAQREKERAERNEKENEKLKLTVQELEKKHSADVKRLERELKMKKEDLDDLSEYTRNKTMNMDQMRVEIWKKMDKIEKLQKRIEDAEKKGLLEKVEIPDPETVKQSFLGLWKLQNPNHHDSDIPRHLLFSIGNDGTFTEQNNGTLCEKYVCKVKAAFGQSGFFGNSTYIEEDELMSESYGRQYYDNYTIARKVRGEKLKMTINWIGKTISMVYKRERGNSLPPPKEKLQY